MATAKLSLGQYYWEKSDSLYLYQKKKIMAISRINIVVVFKTRWCLQTLQETQYEWPRPIVGLSFQASLTTEGKLWEKTKLFHYLNYLKGFFFFFCFKLLIKLPHYSSNLIESVEIVFYFLILVILNVSNRLSS